MAGPGLNPIIIGSNLVIGLGQWTQHPKPVTTVKLLTDAVVGFEPVSDSLNGLVVCNVASSVKDPGFDSRNH